MRGSHDPVNHDLDLIQLVAFDVNRQLATIGELEGGELTHCQSVAGSLDEFTA